MRCVEKLGCFRLVHDDDVRRDEAEVDLGRNVPGDDFGRHDILRPAARAFAEEPGAVCALLDRLAKGARPQYEGLDVSACGDLRLVVLVRLERKAPGTVRLDEQVACQARERIGVKLGGTELACVFRPFRLRGGADEHLALELPLELELAVRVEGGHLVERQEVGRRGKYRRLPLCHGLVGQGSQQRRLSAAAYGCDDGTAAVTSIHGQRVRVHGLRNGLQTIH